MSYNPTFICPFCEKSIPSQINGNQGMLGICGCPESMEAWEAQHRAEIERRKRARRNK